MGMDSRNKFTAAFLAAALGAATLLMAQPAKQAQADAAKGKTVFGAQCSVCHNADSNAKKLGPGLKGLFKKAKLENGKPCNEANVRAAIDNGGNGMPPFKEMLNTADKNNIIAFLKTL